MFRYEGLAIYVMTDLLPSITFVADQKEQQNSGKITYTLQYRVGGKDKRGLATQRGGGLAGVAECRHETRDLQLVRASEALTPRGCVSIVPQQTLKPHIHCSPARVNGFTAPACCCR